VKGGRDDGGGMVSWIVEVVNVVVGGFWDLGRCGDVVTVDRVLGLNVETLKL
jgi:hypothetical protein